MAELVDRKVNVRLIHAKEPGPNFKKDFDKYPTLIKGLERVLCPRVHFKLIIFDLHTVYIGSANLTGAGLGMKSKDNRNFESGILTNNPEIVAKAIEQYDNVWMGKYCASCNRKIFCGDRIDMV
ncbi:MAG: phospholipase D family protein [Bacteroidales bacterium]|nr:phospholipase D family protein [Bacteroidales bacterium]